MWCRPPGSEDFLPLTKATSDNPENAKVIISGPVSHVTVVNEEGRYIFEDLPAGSYQVTASAVWYVSGTQTVELSSGQKVELEPFLLGRGTGIIKGKIVCGGKGIANAGLRAENVATGQALPTTYSEADGSYSMEVPAGVYLVFAVEIFTPECSALAEAYNDTTHKFVVKPGATVIHDVELSLPGPPASSSWSGQWQIVTTQICIGETGSWTATFEISDGEVSGYFDGGELGRGEVSGTISGNHIRWSLVNPEQGIGADLVMAGDISGDTISGSLSDQCKIIDSTGAILEVQPIGGVFTGNMR